MSRPSSRLSHRYGSRSHSRIQRPRSAAPCLMYPETDAAFRHIWEAEEEGDLALTQRPQTSFHYYPEELEEGAGVGVGEVEDPMMNDVDYSHDPHRQAWSVPEDPEPLKLVQKHGYGYRKPDTELTPHWSQWPQPPPGRKPHRPVRHHMSTVVPPAYVNKKRATVQHSVYDPVICDLHYDSNNMTSRMRYGGERNIIMHRGLSPRRAAPPVMPGRQLTQYGGAYGHRDYNNLSSLDLSGPSYNRDYNTSRAPSRESRPKHRHLRAHKQEEGYLHNNSVYYSTTPNVSGYFIIHPDWVSERLSMRRSQSLLSF